MTLDQLAVGQSAHVASYTHLPLDVKKRLLALGLIPQSKIKLVRRAPLGEPLQVYFNGIDLALRGAQARCIEVTV